MTTTTHAHRTDPLLRPADASPASIASTEAAAPAPACLILHLMKAQSYRLGRHKWVTCRLWCMMPDDRCPTAEVMYAISMEGCRMHCLCRVGQKEAPARALYERLVRGRVSPCTLRDIVNDFNAAHSSSAPSQPER